MYSHELEEAAALELVMLRDYYYYPCAAAVVILLCLTRCRVGATEQPMGPGWGLSGRRIDVFRTLTMNEQIFLKMICSATMLQVNLRTPATRSNTQNTFFASNTCLTTRECIPYLRFSQTICTFRLKWLRWPNSKARSNPVDVDGETKN